MNLNDHDIAALRLTADKAALTGASDTAAKLHALIDAWEDLQEAGDAKEQRQAEETADRMETAISCSLPRLRALWEDTKLNATLRAKLQDIHRMLTNASE